MQTNLHKHAAAGLFALAMAMPALAQPLPAPPVSPSALAQGPACNDMEVAIYFSAYDTGLTPQSERVIDAASRQLKGCQVTAISVNVLSEEAHTDEDAAELSEERADNVISALLANGIEPASYRLDVSRAEKGAAGAVPMVEPMARRVSVAFEVQPGYRV